MPAPVTTIRNLGPAMAAAFARAGIDDADTLRGIGADAAYARLLASGHRAHFMAYLALVLGLQDRPFADAGPAEKAALRARFDTICAGTTDTSRARLDAALDSLGVIARPAQPTSSSPEKK